MGNSIKVMIEKKKMLFELQPEQIVGYDECHNYFGFSKIEVLEFNFDGKGNALVLEDEELGCLGNEDLMFLMFGGWYKLNKSQL